MEPTTAASHALWLLIPDGLLEKLNALKPYGSVRILVSNGGMIELRIKLTEPVGLKTDLAIAGTSLTEWIQSSPKPSPGSPSQPSASSSTESGCGSMKPSLKPKSFSKSTTRWLDNTPRICPKCGRKCFNAAGLRSHMRIHLRSNSR